jgi:hypothetical protein
VFVSKRLPKEQTFETATVGQFVKPANVHPAGATAVIECPKFAP